MGDTLKVWMLKLLTRQYKLYQPYIKNKKMRGNI